MNTRKFRSFGPQLTAIAASLLVSAAAFAAGPVAGPAGPANAPAKKTLSAAQLAEAQARVNLANQIVQNVAADALANGATDSWRLSLLANLYNTPSSALQNIRGSATTLGKVQEMALAARAQAAASAAPAAGGTSAASGAGPTSSTDGLGSTTDSLVFTPMTPCRFIDTRNIGTPIGTSAATFDTFNFGSSYGGSGTCTLPSIGEPAIAVNVTVVNPSAAPGYINVRPAGSTQNTSFINWYQSGASVQVANAGIIATALTGGHYKFEMLTGGGTASAIMDYFGYFGASAAVALTVTEPASEAVTLASGYNNFHYTTSTCPSGTTAVSAYCYNSQIDGVYLVGSGVNGGAWCGWRNLTGATQTVYQSTFCASVP
ncbi:hypothetical protein [Rudaea cellulosilytica]|uniref:hypothetical protein n=1 Tax=Rudaea cellulosilytica TaxID=540746 RepID=UPI000373C26E|nr:hypothetical protein [Rudaea cellulosilytica]